MDHHLRIRGNSEKLALGTYPQKMTLFFPLENALYQTFKVRPAYVLKSYICKNCLPKFPVCSQLIAKFLI